MNLIVFLLFFFHADGFAGCRPGITPQTLDLANAKAVRQLRAALEHSSFKVETDCAKDLRQKRADLLAMTRFLFQNLPAMAAEEEKWADRILNENIPANASPEEACRHHRDLTELLDLYDRVDSREDYFRAKFDLVAKLVRIIQAERQIAAAPAKAKILLECREDFREHSMDFEDGGDEAEAEDERREVCLQNADADPDLWAAVKFMEKNSDGYAAGLVCALDPAAGKQVMANLELARTIEKRNKSALSQVKKYFDRLNDKIPARIPRILAAQTALAPWECADRLRADSLKIESSMRKLEAGDGHGSGFVLAGPNGQPELISAHHVGFRNKSLGPNFLKMTDSPGEKQPKRGIEFEVTPGMYDRGRDLVKQSLPSAGALLSAVPAGTILPPGEKVRIYGYPGIREGKLASLGCEVKGIGRNEIDHPDSESYLLSCPGAESHIGGMSGGPALNAKGEVIGMVSAHNALTNVVVVQPLSRSPEGANRFGFQDIFLYDHCFSATDMSAKPKRCQIIPGLTFQKTAY